MNIQKLITAILFSFTIITASAQDKWFTKTGSVDFHSDASLETIEAKNKTATAVLDSKTGGLQFSVQMKGFEFEKSMMQDHFNKNYVHSDQYPKADFAGTITNNTAVNYKKDGSYPVTVKGKMTLHGETKEVEAKGTLKVEGGKVMANSVFNINLSDYKIEIPARSKEKIANTIRITVNANLEPYKG